MSNIDALRGKLDRMIVAIDSRPEPGQYAGAKEELLRRLDALRPEPGQEDTSHSEAWQEELTRRLSQVRTPAGASAKETLLAKLLVLQDMPSEE